MYGNIKKMLKVAEGLKDLTSITMARGKEIPRKKFLVEIEEGIFNRLNQAVEEEGISRNLLMNLLTEYYLQNRSKITSELLKLR